MTKQEAIAYLEDTKCDLPYKFEQAIDMAIEALSAEAVCEDTQAEERTRFVAKETKLAYIEARLENAEKMLQELPKYDIVRCKDCIHYQFVDNVRAFGMKTKYCDWFGFEDVDDLDFCSRGERKGGDSE